MLNMYDAKSLVTGRGVRVLTGGNNGAPRHRADGSSTAAAAAAAKGSPIRPRRRRRRPARCDRERGGGRVARSRITELSARLLAVGDGERGAAVAHRPAPARMRVPDPRDANDTPHAHIIKPQGGVHCRSQAIASSASSAPRAVRHAIAPVRLVRRRGAAAAFGRAFFG